MSFTINDIKKHLGPGLGLRKNRYLIEIPVPLVNGETLNILCQSAGLPERNISTTEMWHKGRKYQVRGETDYIGDYEISIVDDSSMRIRALFDGWLRKVDDSRPQKDDSILGTSFEEISPGLLENISDAISATEAVTDILSSRDKRQDFILGLFNDNSKYTPPNYQVDINIWQMGRGDSSDDDKIYGYKLQNAFPKSIGIVTLEDGDENTLSEFSVTFGFSEFIPLKGRKRRLIEGVFGEDISNIAQGLDNITDELF